MVGVDKARSPGQTGKLVPHSSCQYLQESLQEDNEVERGGGVVGSLTWLVENYPVGFLQGGGVET